MDLKLKKRIAISDATGTKKNNNNNDKEKYRKSNQYLLPLRRPDENGNGYTVYPAFHLERKKIYAGISTLVDYVIAEKIIVIDGYAGLLWDDMKEKLADIIKSRHLKVHIHDTKDWYLPEEEINNMITPYLGEKDAVWGKKCDKKLADFFDKGKIARCRPVSGADVNIVMGVGAALASWNAPIVYLEISKNELQYRMRAGTTTNLGCGAAEEPSQMYKRSYFADWVVLNNHKKDILDKITVVADCQRIETDKITWMYMYDLQLALQAMSKNVFRVRPWFEPGAWGGQWIKENIKNINQDEVNYAWSFELITPENGLLIESDGLLLEVSFDFLMFLHKQAILGKKFAEKFGDEFPIRFDFLDTIRGGNLSIQCHPSVHYINEHFGETFTQDETYYILDADDGASVYLGFQENIEPAAFRKDLERSKDENTPLEVTKYIQCHQAKKHDLFLIPNGTVHSAGAGNLVLEISATPYIYTFKMYDWLRLDLNGKPRPINIAHAYNNLDFSRKGKKVKEELISKPYVLDSGDDWQKIHLPTHREHFYDVHRYEFKDSLQISTDGSCHILMLVEGTSVSVKTKNGFHRQFHYAETFVIPAAAESYILINDSTKEAKIVKAFLKG